MLSESQKSNWSTGVATASGAHMLCARSPLLVVSSLCICRAPYFFSIGGVPMRILISALGKSKVELVDRGGHRCRWTHALSALAFESDVKPLYMSTALLF